jgi:hypothetical protein
MKWGVVPFCLSWVRQPILRRGFGARAGPPSRPAPNAIDLRPHSVDISADALAIQLRVGI